ncbi:MAG: DinB family protein [Anaerolineales bacterium]
MKSISKPAEGEYAPYAITYINLVPPDGLFLEHLQTQVQSTRELILAFPPEKCSWRWAEGEWTIKEILVHILDSERIFCYRALRFARNDATPLAGFEQDAYVPYTGANERTLPAILAEYAAVRQATLTFFDSLDENALTRTGLVTGNRVSVRAAAWMIAGHEIHHLHSIQENYRNGNPA